MTSERRRKPSPSLGIPFEEALARFVQTDPKDLADTYERIKREEEETNRYVEERERSIRSGARRTNKRFRL